MVEYDNKSWTDILREALNDENFHFDRLHTEFLKMEQAERHMQKQVEMHNEQMLMMQKMMEIQAQQSEILSLLAEPLARRNVGQSMETSDFLERISELRESAANFEIVDELKNVNSVDDYKSSVYEGDAGKGGIKFATGVKSDNTGKAGTIAQSLAGKGGIKFATGVKSDNTGKADTISQLLVDKGFMKFEGAVPAHFDFEIKRNKRMRGVVEVANMDEFEAFKRNIDSFGSDNYQLSEAWTSDKFRDFSLIQEGDGKPLEFEAAASCFKIKPSPDGDVGTYVFNSPIPVDATVVSGMDKTGYYSLWASSFELPTSSGLSCYVVDSDKSKKIVFDRDAIITLRASKINNVSSDGTWYKDIEIQMTGEEFKDVLDKSLDNYYKNYDRNQQNTQQSVFDRGLGGNDATADNNVQFD